MPPSRTADISRSLTNRSILPRRLEPTTLRARRGRGSQAAGGGAIESSAEEDVSRARARAPLVLAAASRADDAALVARRGGCLALGRVG